MNQFKIFFQGILLLSFAIFIRFATRRVHLKKRPRINPLTSVATYGVVVLLFLGFYLANFPHLLSATHLKVVEEKAASRNACREASKELSVKRWKWENLQGKRLNSEYHDSFGISSSFNQLANVLLFGMGAMSTVAPFILQLVVAFFAKQFGKEQKLGNFYPLHHQGLSLPAVFAVTIASVAIFFSFHMEADQDRTHLCLLFSGHWFTYFYVTLLGALVLVHFAESKGLYSTYTAVYAGYFAMCQALFLRVLAVTQMFFHDSEEACGGIYRALVYSPLVFGLFMLVEWFNWNKYQKKQKETSEGLKKVEELPEEFKMMLKKAGVTKTELLDEEVMAEIQTTFESFAKSQAPPSSPSLVSPPSSDKSSTMAPPPPPPPSNVVQESPHYKRHDVSHLPPPPTSQNDKMANLPDTSSAPLPPPLVSSISVSKPTASSLVEAMKTLKKVEKPSGSSSGRKVESGTLYSMLLDGIEKRRGAIEIESDGEDSLDTDEEWN